MSFPLHLCRTNNGDQRSLVSPFLNENNACAVVTQILFDLHKPGQRARPYSHGGVPKEASQGIDLQGQY